MKISHEIRGEKYNCIKCRQDINKNEFKKKEGEIYWKCPNCEGEIEITPPKELCKYKLIRKYAKDILDNNSEIAYYTSINKDFEILKITNQGKSFQVALKGHTVVKIDSDDWIDCIFGRNY